MICRRCLLRAAKRGSNDIPSTSHSKSRQFSSSATRHAQAATAQTTTAANPRPNGRPAATSTPAAQPFSTPLQPSPEDMRDLPVEPRQSKQPARVQSSVSAGTVLKGLNFMKNRQDPVAMEDHEYPPWLWGVLQQSKQAQGDSSETEGDLFSKSKKQRRIAAKALRKQQMLNPELLQPKVPLYEQSIDLPAGDGTLDGAKAADEARGELTKAMRKNRRAKIKEGNFLKAMG